MNKPQYLEGTKNLRFAAYILPIIMLVAGGVQIFYPIHWFAGVATLLCASAIFAFVKGMRYYRYGLQSLENPCYDAMYLAAALGAFALLVSFATIVQKGNFFQIVALLVAFVVYFVCKKLFYKMFFQKLWEDHSKRYREKQASDKAKRITELKTQLSPLFEELKSHMKDNSAVQLQVTYNGLANCDSPAELEKNVQQFKAALTLLKKLEP